MTSKLKLNESSDRIKKAMACAGGHAIPTWTISRMPALLSDIQFSSEHLIFVQSRQCIYTAIHLQLFEALLLSVGISGSQTVTSAHSREKKGRIGLKIAAWGWGWITLRGSQHHLHTEGELWHLEGSCSPGFAGGSHIFFLCMLWCLNQRGPMPFSKSGCSSLTAGFSPPWCGFKLCGQRCHHVSITCLCIEDAGDQRGVDCVIHGRAPWMGAHWVWAAEH